MLNLLYSQGVLDDTRAIANSLDTDTCTLYSIGATYSNQGNKKSDFTAYSNIPCRVDDISKGLLSSRLSSNIETQKSLKFIYIPLSYCISNSVVPKLKDEIETSAGHPLGTVTRYSVVEVDTETDEIDITMLVEEQ